MVDDGMASTVSWRELHAEAVAALRADGGATPAQEARWLVEEASGFEGVDHLAHLDHLATERGVARFDSMLARRLAGEPIQYVLGRWAFRSLDLAVDPRVLIPRPETEQVTGFALEELDRWNSRNPERRPLVVDLGTGSGAIALAMATERTGCDVVASERSTEALALARANLAGIGRAATRVRLVEGDWFHALPPELAGAVAVLVSNPPYIAAAEVLPAAVREWEPDGALVAGPTGLEDIERIVAGAGDWLAPGGSLVVEIGETQGIAAIALALGAGLIDAEVRQDLAGRDRALVARRDIPRSEAPDGHGWPIRASERSVPLTPSVLRHEADTGGRSVPQNGRDVVAAAAAARVLRGGGVVLLPTDTVYGIGALPSMPGATAGLIALKDRSAGQPLAVLVADEAQALALIEPPSETARRLMAAFWPGPLTLVMRRSDSAEGLELGGDRGTVGVRCPDHDLIRAIARQVGPIATTSANRHGEPTPATAHEAAAGLVGEAGLVIDGGVLNGVASTVVDLTGVTAQVLREGAITRSQVERTARDDGCE